MPYKICYTPEDTNRYPQAKKMHSVKWARYAMFIILIFAVFWVKVNGLPDLLIPGDPKITKNAVETMISSVESGESMEDVVFVFCKEILAGAES